MTFVDTFGSATVPPSQYGYQALSISSNTALEWPYNSSGGTVVSKLIDLTATVGSLSLTLPDATQVSTGEDLLIRNVGANSVTIKDNAGGTIGTVAAGAASYFYLQDNATAAGAWGLIAYGVGTSNVDAATLVGYGLMASGTTLNQASPVTTDASAAITVTSTYRAKTLVLSGGAATVSLAAAATLGNNFFFFLRNSGTGTATIDPNGAETVDGVATMGIQPGESLMLVCSGVGWYSVGYGRSVLYQFSQLVKDVSAAGTITLTASEASNKLLTFNGNPAADLTVIVPNTVSVYYTQSAISTAKVITVKTAAGTGIALAQSQQIIAICDGTNVVAAQSAAATSAVSYPAGSAAAPSINFSASTNTGFFLKGVNGVGISANGTQYVAVETTGLTFTGHVTVEGVTSTGATGTGKLVFDASPTLSGHPTIEGVTSTGATGTGKMVYDTSPTLSAATITGHPTIEGVTSTGATGTGKFVFDTSPTVSGHPTIEGVTSTGATGTGKFVFDTSPVLVTPALGTPSSGTLTNCTGLPAAGVSGTALVSTDIGVSVQAYDSNTVKSNATKNFTAGYTATSYSAGTKSGGTFTPDPANGNFQYATNGGAHTLAPPANDCTLVIQYTNNASAGTITTSGFTKVTGSTLTTTNTDKFFFFITKCNTYSHLSVQALQ